MAEHSRTRSWPLGAQFPQPGGDDQSEQGDDYRTVAGVGADDPAFRYIVSSLGVLLHLGFDVNDPEMQRQAVVSGRARLEKEQAEQAELDRAGVPAGFIGPVVPYRPDPPPRASWVYYMRIGNRCKIGYTTNLRKRIEAINPEELMALEPGGPKVERQRHDEFRGLRTHGEWFRLAEPLLGHVRSLGEASRSELEKVAHRAAKTYIRVRPGSQGTCATDCESGT